MYVKKPSDTDTENGRKNYQIVVTVSEEIWKIIKINDNKIYMDLIAHWVTDRFYVKRCIKCQQFGHYQKDCTHGLCCGYCRSKEHSSNMCPLKETKDHTKYSCINCEAGNKYCMGHSSHWNRCPTYLEKQEKLKKSIPYYKNQKNEW